MTINKIVLICQSISQQDLVNLALLPDDISALGFIKCLPQQQGLYLLILVKKCYNKLKQMTINKMIPIWHSIYQHGQENIALVDAVGILGA
jgi:hypothetical protein